MAWLVLFLISLNLSSESLAECNPNEILNPAQWHERTEPITFEDTEKSPIKFVNVIDQVWNLLVQKERDGFFPFVKKLQTKEQIQILDLACGVGTDTFVFSSFFSNTGKFMAPNAAGSMVYGIEIENGPFITNILKQYTLKAHPETKPLMDAVALIQADATLDKTYEGLPKLFDLVVIRNPAAKLDDYPLEKILKQAIAHLSPQGKILITTHFNEELQASKASLKNLGLKILDDGPNPGHRNTDTFDRFFLIAGFN